MLDRDYKSDTFAYKEPVSTSTPYSSFINDDLSCPVIGRSLGGMVTRFNKPVLELFDLLNEHFKSFTIPKNFILNSTRIGKGAKVEPIHERVSWFVINVFLIHAARLKSHEQSSLTEAICWFWGQKRKPQKLLSHLKKINVSSLCEKIVILCNQDEFSDLYPYIIEPHGHITRNKRENCSLSQAKRLKKKNKGVFYTPPDVANFMVNELYERTDGVGNWLDPACGTGIFLRAALRRYKNESNYQDNEQSLKDYTLQNLFGVDLSVVSSDSTAFVLLLELFDSCIINETPFYLWSQLRDNIHSMDSLDLSNWFGRKAIDSKYNGDIKHLNNIFCNLNSSKFDHFIMNPPYSILTVSTTHRKGFKAFSNKKVNAKGETHLAFTELMTRLLKKDGVGSAVLPLSIGTNSNRSYRQLRKELLDSGSLEFLFFDREPQALFGEDIKTRNTILFYIASEYKKTLQTSRMIKWTSAKRDSIFNRNRLVYINRMSDISFFPKLGTNSERNLYYELQKKKSDKGIDLYRITLNDLKSSSDSFDTSVLVSGTAYNFINAFFKSGIPDLDKELSSSPLNIINFESKRKAFAAYAILCSKLTYWLWHVEGDGFHLTGAFLKRNPLMNLLSSVDIINLEKLGRRIWNRNKLSITQSVNAGKTTFSFHDSLLSDVVEELDLELLKLLNISYKYESSLREFVEATVLIDGKIRRVI